jgi:dihydropteroate synthase
MSVRRYLRPLSFCYGADARREVEAGRAGALGGMPYISFSQIEVIERGTSVERRVVAYSEIAAECFAITHKRAAVAGFQTDATRIMGIVNVTPDSFSDGGKFAAENMALQHGRQLFSEGAEFVDVGGESTRPGSDAVDATEEERRVLPVISGLATLGAVSVDTRKALVMRKAAAAGAAMINDVSGLTYDVDAAGAVRESGLPVVIMHAKGEPKTMQLAPKYDDVVLDVYDELDARIDAAHAAGIDRTRIIVDPGIGFGKTFAHNLSVLAQLTIYHGLGVPLLVGASRKAFIGALTQENAAANRISGSVGVALQASMLGAHILRVHDVRQTKQALSVFWAGLDPDSAEL